MKVKIKTTLILFALLLAFTSPASGAIPTTINYQGVLTDTEGNAVVDDDYQIMVQLYDVETGGTAIWGEVHTATVVKSIFSIVLGSVNPIDLPFDTQYYLGITIGAAPELTPRVALNALPYSMSSNNADMLDGEHAGAFADSAHAHDDVYFTETELGTTGTLNDSGNPVDWTKLKNVPAGFADGTDDIGLTSVNALDASDGDPVSAVYVDADGNTGIGTLTPGATLDVSGDIIVTNDSGETRSRMYTHAEDAGIVNTFGPNGNLNCSMSAMSGYVNSGYISVCDSDGDKKAAIYVEGSTGSGVITADVKSFRMPNPSLPGTDICYACVEGPEAAAYIRGTARLESGSATVVFPRHFIDVIILEGMTVQLTPLSAESRGLAVVEKGAGSMVVRELSGGTGEYEFDYLVTAVRKGHESYKVIKESLNR